MLIECPECKKEISDKSSVCIHCGYPIQNVESNICLINSVSYDLSNELKMVLENEPKTKIIVNLRNKYGMSLQDAVTMYDILNNTKKIPNEFSCETVQQQLEKVKLSNIPHCPTCNSTNIEKIGGIERGASVAMWGIFSKKINKSFKCKSCGYTW